MSTPSAPSSHIPRSHRDHTRQKNPMAFEQLKERQSVVKEQPPC
jgi:hypothetical protein